jgi:hypothetical protein
VHRGWDAGFHYDNYYAGVDVLGLPFKLHWHYPLYWCLSGEYDHWSDSLPIDLPPLIGPCFGADFSFMEQEAVSGEAASFSGRLTSLHVVPEPATGMLVLAAGGFLVMRRCGIRQHEQAALRNYD